jgi:hypothetical protein
MSAYTVTKSGALSRKIAGLSYRTAFVKALDALIKEICESPRSRGGVIFTGKQWAYPVMADQVTMIDDDEKTVELTGLVHLP